jgi:hypothetical protein
MQDQIFFHAERIDMVVASMTTGGPLTPGGRGIISGGDLRRGGSPPPGGRGNPCHGVPSLAISRGLTII